MRRTVTLRTVVAFATAALVVLVGALSWLLPRTYYVSRSTVVDASPEAAYEVIGDLRTWPRWAAWYRDLGLTLSYGEQTAGVGAEARFRGGDLGRGRMWITEATRPEQLTLKVELQAGGRSAIHRFQLRPEAHGTRVVWSMIGHAGDGLFANWTTGPRERSAVRDFDQSLGSLKACLEQGRCAAGNGHLPTGLPTK